MRIDIGTYISGSSPLHLCDARVKVVLLLAYSLTLFLVETWAGLGLCAVLFAGALAVSGIAVRRVFSPMLPVFGIAVLVLAANGFTLDANAAASAPAGLGAVSAGVLEGAPPIALFGSFGIAPAGAARGCFFAVRILLLVAASLVVAFASSSAALTEAFSWFLRPLRAVRAPVDDMAAVLSVALRFIPVLAEELKRIRDAQWARGASFSEGGLGARIRAWGNVFIPLLASLFRRADSLAVAMDARCYGAPGIARTSLSSARFSTADAIALVAGVSVCAAAAILL